jgi:hypothetical protein
MSLGAGHGSVIARARSRFYDAPAPAAPIFYGIAILKSLPPNNVGT